MKQRPNAKKDPTPTTAPAGIRQLIADGKYKLALDAAKDFHRASPGPESEALLIDAYSARIDALAAHGMEQEAASLRKLVLERFPDAGPRLAGSTADSVDDLLRPLADPALTAEVRKEVEQRIRTDAWNLAAIAESTVLPPDHPLRAAAAALDKAFVAVTSRNVTDDELLLPEVSHRSPLSPWKLLIRAIAEFHRGDDAKCRDSLALVNPDSAPARLVPALARLAGEKGDTALSPSAAKLVDNFGSKTGALKAALAKLQDQFDNEAPNPEIYKTLQAVTAEAKRTAPDVWERIKRFIFIRGSVEGITEERIVSGIGGLGKVDTETLRLLARGYEDARNSEFFPDACIAWHEFLDASFKDGKLAPRSVEAAAVYLHMAGLLAKSDPANVEGVWLDERRNGTPDLYFMEADSLFSRACAIDPHSAAFSQWLRWTSNSDHPNKDSVKVAETWHKALPRDIEPLLFLMDKADERNAFKKALDYLQKAEGIDQVNTKVRAARLRLLARAVTGHLKRRKPALAAEKLRILSELPAANQGDRPLMLEALAWRIALDLDDLAGAKARVAAVATALGEDGTRFLLNTVCNTISAPPEMPPNKQRKGVPPDFLTALARVAIISPEFGMEDIWVTVPDLKDAAAQIKKDGASLSTDHLLALGRVGEDFDWRELSHAVTVAGLGRSPESDPAFLLLRAVCLPGGPDRRDICAQAAAVLGREQRNDAVVTEALEFRSTFFGPSLANMTVEQAREVARKEKEARSFPKYGDRGPDYRDLIEARCDCPACRRKRGESISPEQEERWYDEAAEDLDASPAFDDDMEEELRSAFFRLVPSGIPPEVARSMFDIFRTGMREGIPPELVMSQMRKMLGQEERAGKKGKRG